MRHVQLVPYSSATGMIRSTKVDGCDCSTCLLIVLRMGLERRNNKRLKKKNLKKKAVSQGEAPSSPVRMPRASHAVVNTQAAVDQSALAVAMMGAPGQVPGSPTNQRKVSHS